MIFEINDYTWEYCSNLKIHATVFNSKLLAIQFKLLGRCYYNGNRLKIPLHGWTYLALRILMWTRSVLWIRLFFQFTRFLVGLKNHQHQSGRPVSSVISPINVYDRKLDIAETGLFFFILHLTLPLGRWTESFGPALAHYVDRTALRHAPVVVYSKKNNHPRRLRSFRTEITRIKLTRKLLRLYSPFLLREYQPYWNVQRFIHTVINCV